MGDRGVVALRLRGLLYMRVVLGVSGMMVGLLDQWGPHTIVYHRITRGGDRGTVHHG